MSFSPGTVITVDFPGVTGVKRRPAVVLSSAVYHAHRMSQQLSPSDEELYRRTDEVLHYLWDPIGVAGMPGARDEYDAYLPQVFSLLKQGAEIETIADYLFEVTTQSIGLGGRRDRDRQIAETLIEWRIAILGS